MTVIIGYIQNIRSKILARLEIQIFLAKMIDYACQIEYYKFYRNLIKYYIKLR